MKFVKKSCGDYYCQYFPYRRYYKARICVVCKLVLYRGNRSNCCCAASDKKRLGENVPLGYISYDISSFCFYYAVFTFAI